MVNEDKKMIKESIKGDDLVDLIKLTLFRFFIDTMAIQRDRRPKTTGLTLSRK